MKKKRHNTEQIVKILRKAKDQKHYDICREHEISEQTLYRWKRKDAGT